MQAQILNILNNRILHHILFWVFIFYTSGVIQDIDQTQGISTTALFTLMRLFQFVLVMTMCYLTIWYILPIITRQQNYGKGILLLIANFIGFGLLLFLLSKTPYHLDYTSERGFNFNTFLSAISSCANVLIILIPIKLIRDYIRDTRRMKELKKNQATTELSLLKTQINPYFFFSTLDDLKHLAKQNDKSTPDAIYNLSNIMRYTLYDTETEKVLLSNELKAVETFLDIKKASFGNHLSVHIDVKGSVQDGMIPPLVLLNIVANCFTASYQCKSSNCYFKLTIDVEQEGKIRIAIEHNLDTKHHKAHHQESKALFQKRLDLLYQDNYRFTNNSNEQQSNIALEI